MIFDFLFYFICSVRTKENKKYGNENYQYTAEEKNLPSEVKHTLRTNFMEATFSSFQFHQMLTIKNGSSPI